MLILLLFKHFQIEWIQKERKCYREKRKRKNRRKYEKQDWKNRKKIRKEEDEDLKWKFVTTKFALNNFLQKKRRKRKIASRWCLAHHRMVASVLVTVIATNNTVTRKGVHVVIGVSLF